MNTQFKERRYRIDAKRDHDDNVWTEWSLADEYEEAVNQLNIIRSLGYYGRIVDKSGIAKIAKLLEEEYDKAKKLDYVKNPMAYALYSVWKKVDKEGKKK